MTIFGQVFIFVACFVCSLADNHDCSFNWSYTGSHGPANWGQHCATCNGNRQSPIDIPFNLQSNLTLGQITMTGYDTDIRLKVQNTGHTIKATVIDPGNAKISGGGLVGDYIPGQFHFHWGSDTTQGSEHTFRGKMAPLELHIVHYKAENHNISNSLDDDTGLAVLGFFFYVGEANAGFDPLVTAMEQTTNKGDYQNVTMRLSSLLPSSTDHFYRYLGSLTTPPCSEAVVWTVFDKRGQLSQSQLAVFRGLSETASSEAAVSIVNNYRPVIPLGTRQVSKNYDTNLPASYRWGYIGQQGADYWPMYYEGCAGSEQSPIDLQDTVAEVNVTLGNLKVENYDVNMAMELHNNGHTVQLSITSDHYMSEGGLPGRYKVAQVHFHWGSDWTKGSEHFLNGRAYPLEMHIVHFGEQYTFAQATTVRDGLAVLGVFFEVGGSDNPKFSALIQRLADVKYKGQNVMLSGFSLETLTFTDLGSQPFYRYMGSLTTPTCNEAVVWTVLQNTIRISAAQMAAFRQLTEDVETGTPPSSPHYMVNNFRPVQNLGNRKLYINYRDISAAPSAQTGSMVLTLLITFASSIISKFM